MCGGGVYLTQWNVPVWEHSLERGVSQLRLAIDTHIITSHYALPLLMRNKNGLVIEITDGTAEYNDHNHCCMVFTILTAHSQTFGGML